MTFAFLFPGQGSQSLNMMDGFSAAVVKDTFDEASEALGDDLWAMLKADSSDAINQTVNTQPLMLAAGVATFRAWLAAGGRCRTSPTRCRWCGESRRCRSLRWRRPG